MSVVALLSTHLPYLLPHIASVIHFDYGGYSYYMHFVGNSFYSSLESTFTVYLGLHNASFLNYPGQTPSPPAVAYSVSKAIVV